MNAVETRWQGNEFFMAKSLIIVESPAKTKTLKNFLGDDYIIEASMGHVRDLPKMRLGVKVDKDFEPTYEPLADRGDVLKRLTAAAKGVSKIYLASDPDREGEAIAWHLAEALKIKNPLRIQFNEITKQAVQEALANPREVNMDVVNAQQARRVLDRLIGYKLSPVLSKKIQKGLSAGRVQSVAVRMICDRERAIKAFVPEEYWSLIATLTPVKPEKKQLFPAKLNSRAGKKLEPKSEQDIAVILADIEGAKYEVAEVKKREQKSNAAPPFITSTLQQEASRKLGFGNRKTMSVAQSLYEGVELGSQGSVGLITYMRTDSVRIGADAQAEAIRFIKEKYDSTLTADQARYSYAPVAPKQFKTKGAAQDAHEAIRPTSAYREPDTLSEYLSRDEYRLYRLIWQRFLASQMNPAVKDLTSADINATSEKTGADPYVFRATGSIIKFDGFMRVYTEGKDDSLVGDDEQPPLPPLAKGQPLDLNKLEPAQHFTQPPPRYTEATIVKALEEQGIGRPSTYASIISTIRDRKYVDLVAKAFVPTDLGMVVTDQLVKHFAEVMDMKFTAEMENKLDEVEEGKQEWVGLLRNFYTPFEILVKAAGTEMENLKPQPVETEFKCPDTGTAMVMRQGRYGPFISCSGFPKCRKILKMNADGTPVEGENFTCGMLAQPAVATDGSPAPPEEVKDPVESTADLPNATDFICPDKHGRMLTRNSRFGPFLGCSAYPKCSTALKINADGTLKDGQEFTCTYSAEGKAKRGRASAARKPAGAKRAVKV